MLTRQNGVEVGVSWLQFSVILAMLLESHNGIYVKPGLGPIKLEEDVAFFYLKQRISVYLTRELGTWIGRRQVPL